MPELGWRFFAQDIITREWLADDLELRDVDIIDELSGPGGIMASIAPELRALTVNGGRRRLLQEWQTAVYAEKDGRIRGAGILVHSAAQDDSERWDIECAGWTAYAKGMPYTGDLTWWDADPFDVVREIWRHLQSFRHGDIGLLVSNATTSFRLGPPEPPPRPADYVDPAALKAPLKGNKPNKGNQPKRKKKESDSSYDTRVLAWEQAYDRVVLLWEHDYQVRHDAYEAAKARNSATKFTIEAEQQAWDDQYGSFEPYKLSWWEAPDCGSEIDSLATLVPFEYREHHQWNDDRSDVEHYLDLEWPSGGSRRNDLRFAVGENVIVIPPPEFDGDEFANEILGLGKGDGQAMLRSEVSEPDDRLRRVRVMPAKEVGDQNRLRGLADAQLRFARFLGDVSELVVVDHENAPLGSFRVGDEVFIRAGGDGWFTTDLWVRIVEITVRPEDDTRMTLAVVASERV
jgi:hypothetical protein